MERIRTLLEKIKELQRHSDPGIIELDLMLDYTRVLYADLLEWRNKIAFRDSILPESENTTSEPAFSYIETEPVKTEESLPEVSPKKILFPREGSDTSSQGSESSSFQLDISTPAFFEKDIRTHIGINDKYQFISELFSNNRDAYEEVILRLNECRSFEEATSWIRESVTDQYQWPENNDSVQLFYNTLEDFFEKR